MMLYIVRHGLAGEHGDPRYPDDRLRPLTVEGRKRFTCSVNKVVPLGMKPEGVASSPLVRCRQTADLLSEALPARPAVTELESLAPDSNLIDLIAWTSEQGDRDVAWVGHAPDVGRLVAELIGDGGSTIRLAKGAIAAIRFEKSIHRGGGELCWLLTAKVLGC